jgi:hypothetical protein
VQFVGNRFRTIAPLKRKGPGYGVPDRVGEWFEWRQVAQHGRTQIKKSKTGEPSRSARYTRFSAAQADCVRKTVI